MSLNVSQANKNSEVGVVWNDTLNGVAVEFYINKMKMSILHNWLNELSGSIVKLAKVDFLEVFSFETTAFLPK